MDFQAITFYPNGKVWDQSVISTEEQDRGLVKAFGPCISFENRKCVSSIETEIGELKLDWVGSDQFGVGSSTWWLGKNIINTGLCLYGCSEESEKKALELFLGQWQSVDLVKELCGERVPFLEVYDIASRPLMVSVNWAAIKSEEYDKVSNFDICLAAVFFEGMRVVEKIS